MWLIRAKTQEFFSRRWDVEWRGQTKWRMAMNTWPSELLLQCNVGMPHLSWGPWETSRTVWLTSDVAVSDFVIILILVSCCYVIFLSYFWFTLLFLFPLHYPFSCFCLEYNQKKNCKRKNLCILHKECFVGMFFIGMFSIGMLSNVYRNVFHCLDFQEQLTLQQQILIPCWYSSYSLQCLRPSPMLSLELILNVKCVLGTIS